MDRRTTLRTLLQPTKTAAPRTRKLAEKGSGSLQPYLGPWNEQTAAHLLRRASFGPTQAEIDQAVQLGLSGTINKLFEEQPLPPPPINHINNSDPNVPIGETWIEAPYFPDVNLRAYRIQSLQGWTIDLLLQSGLNIREKMTLFWHNHFVTERTEVNDPKFQYVYITLLREQALGNFRELTKKITIDPSMLRYLNGNQNTRNNPNENYARELLELFTIGKGLQVGPGDYTNYTEDDVVEMARVLTGWIVTGFNTNNPDVKVGSEYRNNRHDLGAKTLSHRFDNEVITNMADLECAHLIDVIFQQDECARFIARKLYRWFVYYDIPQEVEAQVIQPMADLILLHDYDMAPVVQALLASEHFYDECVRGVMIKHPVDFLVGMLRQSGWSAPGQLIIQYRYWRLLFQSLLPLQMVYYDPPGVAGWKAWYQDPAWYQSWLNSVTLPARTEVVKLLAYTGIRVGNNPFAMFPVLAWVATLPNPIDPNDVIEGFARQLFPRTLSQTRHDFLKEVLIPGLPDYEWTIEYTDHLADPGDTELANAVANKLRNLIATMMQMPEYQLS